MKEFDFGDVEISISEFTTVNERRAKIAIFRGGFGTDNPTPILEEAISNYVGNSGYNEYVEVHLDNPWYRIIVGGANDIKFKSYQGERMEDE